MTERSQQHEASARAVELRALQQQRTEEIAKYAQELADKAVKDGSISLTDLNKSLLPLISEFVLVIHRCLKSKADKTALAAAQFMYDTLIKAPVVLKGQQAVTQHLQVHTVKELEEIMRERGHDEFTQAMQDAEERADRVQVGEYKGIMVDEKGEQVGE